MTLSSELHSLNWEGFSNLNKTRHLHLAIGTYLGTILPREV
jgi:hypothetical protein